MNQSGRRLDVEWCDPNPDSDSDWSWFEDYFQVHTDYEAVLNQFPRDPVMVSAVEAWRGLRLLRQDPWECLAGFILPSTKRIPQIEQIMHRICDRLGEPARVPWLDGPVHCFPSPQRVADAGEEILRDCKSGFRAPYLWNAAHRISTGDFDLLSIAGMNCQEARMKLMELHGVGRKIADCVLLFAFGFQEAFPIDVWVARALNDFYLSHDPSWVGKDIQSFAGRYFGPMAGYAQQYLFHYIRMKEKL